MDRITEVQQLIKDSVLSKKEIATLAGVSERWIYKFQNDEFGDVGVRRLDRIVSVLSLNTRNVA